MYNIVLCDDNKDFIEYLKKIIGKCELSSKQIVFNEYLSGTAMLDELRILLRQGYTCDLLILDMQMEKGVNGNDIAKQFRELYPEALLVFCSGVYKPTDESFKTYPYRYLLKSYTHKRMRQEMQNIVDKLVSMKKEPYIVGVCGREVYKVKASDVLYFQNYKHGSLIHVAEGVFDFRAEDRYITKQKLEYLYKILGEYGFEYAHNSFLVNMDRVVSINLDGNLDLENGEKLNISRSKMKNFKNAFVSRMGSKY